MRCWIDGLGINFPKEAHQTSDGPLVDFHDCFDDVVAQFGVRKGLAEPVELLDRALPRQWITETAFVSDLLTIECAAIFGLDGDTRVQLVRIFCGEGIVRTNLYPAQQGLSIGGLDTRLLKLGGSDLVVQERCSNEVFQIVIRLFLCLRSILWAERATARNVKPRLENVATDGLDVPGGQAMVSLQLEHGLQNRLAVN